MVPPSALEGFSVLQRGSTFYFLSRAPEDCSGGTRSLKVVSVGLPAIRKVGRHLKPTSSLLRLLSPWIKKNRVRLTHSQAMELLCRGSIKVSTAEEGRGYVMVETDNLILGCGLLQKNTLRSQIPTSGAFLERGSQLPGLEKMSS